MNDLECWNAYKSVPDVDITAIAYGSTRRWDSLFPHSPSGFVPLVPFSTRDALERLVFCNRSFETDVDSWTEFGWDLAGARDAISSEIVHQRDANALLAVVPSNASDVHGGESFWQLTEATATVGGVEEQVLFLLLMDPGALSPAERRVTLRLGGGGLRSGKRYAVFDQLGSQTKALGTLSPTDAPVAVTIPAGSARFFALRALG